ncbi:MAG: hypothetical protein GX277_00305 [Bacteroidales bacterium]|nr:hypothetical protein [Bacteroidales bacterium]HPY82224.1 hypothetical protein [Bacteroidales bacterium]
MKKVFTLGFAIFLTSLTISSFSQSACVEYHVTKCKNPDSKGYSVAEASRSALLLKGQTSEFRFTIYQGKDYRITICGEDALGPYLQYQIVDWETNEVLYDNKDYNYTKEFEFTVLMSKTVRIVVTIPSDSEDPASKSISLRPKSTSMGCIGVLIEEMITPKKGF